MNIAIVRTFVMLRKMASNYQAVMRKLETLEKKYEGRFDEIYKTLSYLIDPPTGPMRQIGFRRNLSRQGLKCNNENVSIEVSQIVIPLHEAKIDTTQVSKIE
ncbi:MAG: hypothetical protein ACOYXT_08115 [Bacteroidota bacterium]